MSESVSELLLHIDGYSETRDSTVSILHQWGTLKLRHLVNEGRNMVEFDMRYTTLHYSIFLFSLFLSLLSPHSTPFSYLFVCPPIPNAIFSLLIPICPFSIFLCLPSPHSSSYSLPILLSNSSSTPFPLPLISFLFISLASLHSSFYVPSCYFSLLPLLIHLFLSHFFFFSFPISLSSLPSPFPSLLLS